MKYALHTNLLWAPHANAKHWCVKDNSPEAAAEFDTSISKLTADIERMAPNMKAIDRLEDVEKKLVESEKEADKARKDSKSARDQFNDVKRRRYVLEYSLPHQSSSPRSSLLRLTLN